MHNESLIYGLDIFGTMIFAFSGVLVAARKHMDFIGVLVLSAAVAVGGGTVRDLLLRVDQIFWIADNTYIYVILASCVVGVLWLKWINYLDRRLLPVCDAIGLAVFLGIGFNKALMYNTSYTVAIILGTMTGVGGGIIRDILSGEVPTVLKKEFYASTCLVGGLVIVGLEYTSLTRDTSLIIGMMVTLIARLCAIKYSLRLPEIKL